MKIATPFLFGGLFFLNVFMPAMTHAQTLYALPLSSYPGISAWYDHNPQTNLLLRYDGATSFEYDNHHGTDFPAPHSSSILSGAAGNVYYSVDGCYEYGQPGYDSSCGGGFGNHVRLSHADGHVSIYAHMEKGSPICACLSVICGASIGRVGASGFVQGVTGVHLHFELWSDKNITQRLDFFGGQPNNHPNYWKSYNNPAASRCQ